ncbi:hypothetical protein TSTA_094630 [Talaromyces stipitatus ATCC 10500]|uniref:Major facilitator superfamily (MFS) profile domain-containing protein n=1 Tax=Talaromyces stipitatus (strain ATCC 10500 / CBS 375.48 / QM 6759 / NRRL 1006) TaxID=441959 RepID=B8M2W2_TALSN|nr:uncharacterized protein TSTA_094630 [Talaromyces stipitatus ATCC 10500]EED22217.1 hypothetical protein TSTA_094630 [Talaromyces stipitatus ATCC 10500]
MAGALISGPLNDTFGRKTVLWIASFLVLAGGVVQVADTHYEGVIVLDRFGLDLVSGISLLLLSSISQSMGEVAPVEIQSPALYMYQFLQSFSQLVASWVT